LFVRDKSPYTAYNQTSKNLGFEVWHQRIGHITINKMRLLPIDVVFPKASQNVLCDICPKAKQ